MSNIAYAWPPIIPLSCTSSTISVWLLEAVRMLPVLSRDMYLLRKLQAKSGSLESMVSSKAGAPGLGYL